MTYNTQTRLLSCLCSSHCDTTRIKRAAHASIKPVQLQCLIRRVLGQKHPASIVGYKHMHNVQDLFVVT